MRTHPASFKILQVLALHASWYAPATLRCLTVDSSTLRTIHGTLESLDDVDIRVDKYRRVVPMLNKSSVIHLGASHAWFRTVPSSRAIDGSLYTLCGVKRDFGGESDVLITSPSITRGYWKCADLAVVTNDTHHAMIKRIVVNHIP